jgi:hypothetical protein
VRAAAAESRSTRSGRARWAALQIPYSDYAAEGAYAGQNVVHMRFAVDALFAAGVPLLVRTTWGWTHGGLRRSMPVQLLYGGCSGWLRDHLEWLGLACFYDAQILLDGLCCAVKLFTDRVPVWKVVL